jgi:hypothetical protein
LKTLHLFFSQCCFIFSLKELQHVKPCVAGKFVESGVDDIVSKYLHLNLKSGVWYSFWAMKTSNPCNEKVNADAIYLLYDYHQKL